MLNPKLNTENLGKRVNIILPEQTIERINNIKNLTAASSVTDVIRTAILTYEALIEYLADGNTFYLKNERDSVYVPVKFLFDVRRNVQVE